ncbi:tRNA/rRNA methyltransferase [Gaoshiqia sp. Z1-71]|uniref:tRNA/rRNA methyltransferase n=1 Tax=Gaoshiqia hydrogeniformans TaxID=3290090 RepID=UPI003BF7DE13
MNMVFILVEPSTPENVGAAARAMKTMGFGEMRLVNPCDHLSGPARWLAHASNDILEQAQVFASFEAAISDLDFVIGTTAKQRLVKEDYLSTRDLPGLLLGKGQSIQKVAIVFGREDSGLRNDELKQCDLVSTVPLQTNYPSLNLAQAVMLYAYELSSLKACKATETKSVNENGFRSLKEKTAAILLDLEFREDSAIYPRILERLNFLSESDIHLIHSICNKYLDQNKSN